MRAILFLVLTCALWGISFPVVKVLQLEQLSRHPEASGVFLASWIQVARFGLAALILLPLIAHLPRPTRLEVRQGLLLGLWGGLGMGIQTWGLGHTEASTSAFLTQAYCVLLPLIACLRSRRRPTLRIVGATILVILGGAILSGVRPDHLHLGIGEQATLVSAVFFTIQILNLEAPKYNANRGRPVTLMMSVGITLLWLPVAFYTAPSPSAVFTIGASLPAVLLVASLALFCSVGAYLIMNTWQRRVSATEAGLIYTTEPVFAAAYALVLPATLATMTATTYANEKLTTSLVIGGALILLANLWTHWKLPAHKPTLPPTP
jgi:drug/metabolite transporter (DMT)-like permease